MLQVRTKMCNSNTTESREGVHDSENDYNIAKIKLNNNIYNN